MPHLTAVDMLSRTMPRKGKNWIAKAVPKERKGVFREKAERAGKTTAAFAKEHEHDKGALGKEARLAENFAHMRKRRKSPLHDNPRSHNHG